MLRWGQQYPRLSNEAARKLGRRELQRRYAAKILHIDKRRFTGYSYSSMAAPISLNQTLHAIADPTRRRILQALKQRNAGSPTALSVGKNGLCAGDIEERIQLSQPTISHHMAILTKAGLVESAKQGQWRWYRRNEKALRRLVKTLRTQL